MTKAQPPDTTNIITMKQFPLSRKPPGDSLTKFHILDTGRLNRRLQSTCRKNADADDLAKNIGSISAGPRRLHALRSKKNRAKNPMESTR